MRNFKIFLILAVCFVGFKSAAQELPVQLQELTAVQFKEAVKKKFRNGYHTDGSP